MIFSGMTFLFFFLPIVLGVHMVLPQRSRWRGAWLLAASVAFYAWAEVRALPLLLLCTLWTYGFGRGLARARQRGKGTRLLLVLGMALPAGALFYCKYAGFFADSLNDLFGAGLTVPKVALPLGISFYTFQMIAYLVDIYRGAEAETDLLCWSSYVLFFGKMVAGPIARYPEMRPYLRSQQVKLQDFAEGVWRFCIGLGKKAILSASLGELTAEFLASSERSMLYCWLFAAAVALHIYFDFSGYSDMAVGIGKLFGIPLPENFDYPLVSATISEFWRRWHKSLGGWFRDYLYIPLGGSRKGTGRLIVSIAVVWLFTGLWHGADWGYAAWGIYFGLLILLEKLVWGKVLRKLPRVIKHGYVLLSVWIGFVVFGGQAFGESLRILGGMFTGGAAGVQGRYALRSYGVLLAVSMAMSLPIWRRAADWARQRRGWREALAVARPIWAAAVLLLSVAWLVDGSFSPFLYAKF